jgi:ribonucleoside-diphosphate reductase alpha chain
MTKDGCLQISSKDRKFLMNVKLMLNTLGATGTLTGMRDCWRLSISASHSWRLHLLGLNTGRVNAFIKPQREASRFIFVTENEPDEIAENVFCFNESLNHSGIFGGVLTANCGEQPLPPYGACLLGSANLVKYFKPGVVPEFDWELFEADIPVYHAAMDNVVDRAIYPLREQEIEAHSKRRMGMGITGLANAAERLGFPYGSPEFLAFEERILRIQVNALYKASALRARDKGSFPMYNAEKYLASEFVNGGALNDDTIELMRKYGARNSHLGSIAPTGTISLSADNVTSGLEPVFAYNQRRTVRSGLDETKEVDLPDYGYATWGVKGKLAEDVTVDEHVKVLVTAARYIDSAISKTCNVPADTSWEEFKSIYMRAWEGGAKGCTTYQVEGKRTGILAKVDEPKDEAWTCEIINGVRECG